MLRQLTDNQLITQKCHSSKLSKLKLIQISLALLSGTLAFNPFNFISNTFNFISNKIEDSDKICDLIILQKAVIRDIPDVTLDELEKQLQDVGNMTHADFKDLTTPSLLKIYALYNGYSYCANMTKSSDDVSSIDRAPNDTKNIY